MTNREHVIICGTRSDADGRWGVESASVRRLDPVDIPRSRQWLGRVWPPAAFPSIPFVFDTPEAAGSYVAIQEVRRLAAEEAARSRMFVMSGRGVWSGGIADKDD